MIFPNVTFSISVTGIHKHSLNFDLRDHHLILYSRYVLKINIEHSIKLNH